jgi:hypothetical protein
MECGEEEDYDEEGLERNPRVPFYFYEVNKMNSFNPVVCTTAIFLAIFFMDLSQRNYKNLPIHALTGFFCVLLVSTLVQLRFYGTAWLLVASPFLIIIGSIMIRDHLRESPDTLQPTVTRTRFDPAPYYL